MRLTSSYGALARVHGLPALYGAAIVAGLPAGVLPLALVVLVESTTGSLAAAGIVLAAQVAGVAGGAPVWTRLSDRMGQRPILAPLAGANALALVLTVVLAEADAATPLLALSTLLAGLSYPPIGSSLRVVLADLLDTADQRQAAYSLQAVSVEVIYIGGPGLAGLIIAIGSPQAAVLCAAVASLIGGLAFASHRASRSWQPSRTPRKGLGVLATPGVRTLLLSTMALGGVLGGLDVAAPAFAAEQGEAAEAGLALACLGVGSFIGGIIFGARRWPGTPPLRYVVLLGLLGLFLGLLVLPTSILGLAAVMFLVGTVVAPLSASGFAFIDTVAPPEAATEATGWIVTAYTAGAALGSSLAGGVASWLTVEWAFVATAAIALAGAATTFGRRRSLQD